MKEYDLMFHKILKCILCVMMLVFVMQHQNVCGEEGSLYEAGGKHNGPVTVDPLGGDDGYSAVLYNNTNGLPTSEANDIVQTQEGFIWIGSYAGLIRYDGSRFERMDSTAGITSVKCLYVDSMNRLWIGTNDSGVVMIHNDDTYHWDLHDGMKSVSVRSLLEGEDGKIYVATTEGLLSIDQNFKMSYVEDLRVVDAFIHELRMGIDGRIYGVTNPGDVVVLKDGKVEEYHRLSHSSFGGINCILPDPHDPSKIYVETQDGRVYHDTLKGGFENSTPIDISPLDQVHSMEYLGGKIWFTTRNGIGVLDEEGFHVLKNIPMKNSIGHVMSDYEGNLWFTSTREGVMKIVKNRFSDLFERYELSDRVVNSTCMYDGDLFIATDTGLIVIDENGPLEKVKLNESIQIYGEERNTDDLLELLDNCRIRSIIRDSKDRLWISTWRKYGLLCYDHGDLRSFRKEEGLASDAIRMVDECIDGRILVAGNGGVSIIKDDRVVATYTEKDGITNTDVLCVVEGEGDDIIVGSDGAGIFILSKNGMKHFDHNSGLSSDAVMRIKFDERNDVYWIVTGNSLSYLSRDYELHKADLFPYSNNFDIYFNSKGELWVLSSNGIYIAKAEDILSGEEINTVHYSMSDGLPCIATANSYSELTDDGDLYIAGTTGVAKVNIEDPFEEMKDLKFAIPYLEADGKKIYPDKDGVFFVTYNTRKLTIYGYVYTYSLTEPLISYRLDGFDEENTTGTAAEVFPVYYTNLRGGTYHFIVELQQSLTGESVGTVIRIEKELALYESVWFYLYSFLSALLVLYALIGLYIDGREKKLERKHKEESEKQQIANEMKMGNDIQQSTLPHVFPPFPERTEFELFASMDPAREVGGDFYDFFFIDDDHLCLIMADVSGKGIPGALFMMVSKAILNNSAMIYDSPAKILTKANEAICANNRAKMFVTVWLGILEVSTGKLKAANAGHEYPIIRKPQGGFEIFKDKHDFVIGGLDNFVYHQYEMDLEPGSKIFLYTDGIPEATDSKERLFGMENLLKALNEDPDAGPEQLTINVRKAVDGFVKEAEQFDDLTMMCLEYKGKE